MATILLLHPGAMGSALGECLVGAGHDVRWVSAGRSPATAARAEAAGLTDSRTLAEGVAAADAVVSICPPDEALDVARRVADAASGRGVSPLYVDANAVAPVTMAAIVQTVSAAGLDAIDGGVVGPPPRAPGRTRLFLSGDRAETVAGWFAGTHTETVILGDAIGQASALKMLYAAWTKQSAALILQISAGADAYGVTEALTAEWERSQPALAGRAEWATTQAAPKAWRWKGEMEEIAATFAQHGLPAGFSLAAAEVFRRLEECKDSDPGPPMEEIVRLIRRG